jgi:hypothetical protein
MAAFYINHALRTSSNSLIMAVSCVLRSYRVKRGLLGTGKCYEGRYGLQLNIQFLVELKVRKLLTVQ